MANSERNSTGHTNRGAGLIIGAGLLILLGAALQWMQDIFVRFATDNSWLFATVFGGVWNAISIWVSAAAWRQDLQYWPLLLVITGAAMLCSRKPERVAVSESLKGGRQND